MKKKARIAVLVSGGGTNLQAILDAAGRGELSDGEVTLVISDRAGAYALERATMAGIPSVEINKKACGGQKAFEAKLLAALEENRTDLIVLAGFLSILTEDFTARYPRRIINVHPSLIPSFCGAGYYGLKVHEAALGRGVKVRANGEKVDIGLFIIVEYGFSISAVAASIIETVKYKVERLAGIPVGRVNVCVEDIRV